MKVFQQLTTGRIHRRRNCGVTSRTRYNHAEREMTEAELATAAKCQRCWIETVPVHRFAVGQEIVHRHSSPESGGDFVVELIPGGYVLRASQTGEDYEIQESDDWFAMDDLARLDDPIASRKVTDETCICSDLGATGRNQRHALCRAHDGEVV